MRRMRPEVPKRLAEITRPWERIAFVALLLLGLASIWSVHYLPTQDGPSHMQNAKLLLDYGQTDRHMVRYYYRLNAHPDPTWFGYLVLAGLITVFPPWIAEKILLSGYIVLLPLSVLFALRATQSHSVFLTFLIFPFVFTYTFHLGFYMFCFSMPGFFLLLGYWMRTRGRFCPRGIALLAASSLLLYCCHLISLAMAYIWLGLLATWFSVLESCPDTAMARIDFTLLARRLQERTVALVIAFMPTILLVGLFLVRQGVGLQNRAPVWRLLAHLVSLSSLVSYSLWEFVPATIMAIMFGVISVALVVRRVRERTFNEADGFVGICVVCVLLYLFVPDQMAGGSFMTLRLILFPYFALILWFASHHFSERVRTWIVGVSIAVTLSLLGIHVVKYKQLTGYIQEYMAGGHLVGPNQTVLALSFADKGRALDGRPLSLRVAPFMHAASYIAAERSAIDLTNYEAWSRYFPVVYREELNPHTHIFRKSTSDRAADIEFLSYEERTGGTVDYVLLWGLTEQDRRGKAFDSIAGQLRRGYELMYISPQTGSLTMYRRKKIAASEASSTPFGIGLDEEATAPRASKDTTTVLSDPAFGGRLLEHRLLGAHEAERDAGGNGYDGCVAER
jgi:hypothetical protein